MHASRPEVIYLDNNATTRVAPEVFEAMVPFLTEYYGNPSSAYSFGKFVEGHLKEAREKVAALLGCTPKEIIFTSCGTESDNAAIWSALQTSGKKHVVTTQVEHSAIMNQTEWLEKMGFGVTRLPVQPDGTLSLSDVENAIRDDTGVVSIMWANNETGVIFPVEEIAAICKRKGVLFHTDAVQTPGKIDLRHVVKSDIDLLSMSGHKLHAPKGVGVLYAKKRTKLVPYVIGGGQERGKRGGTENVASIIGLGRAAELALEKLSDEQTAPPLHQRQARPAASEHLQHRLRLRRGRSHPHAPRPQRHLRLLRLRLHHRLARPLARPQRHGHDSRPRPQLRPLLLQPLQQRRRHSACPRDHPPHDRGTARHVAPGPRPHRQLRLRR